MLASAVRTIKGKTAWLNFRQRDAAISAGEFFRENQIALAGDRYNHHAFTQTQSRFHRVGQTRAIHTGLRHHPVHHQFTRVFFIAVKLKRERLLHWHNFSVDSYPDVAGARDVFQHRLVLASFVADHWREHGNLRSFFQRYYPINYLGRGLPGHRLPTAWTMRLARSREQKP